MAAHCFMYEFTDLGWHELGEDGVNAAKRRPGFVWHTGPGCVLLPDDTRICFLRCDTVTCMMGEVGPATRRSTCFLDLYVYCGLECLGSGFQFNVDVCDIRWYNFCARQL